MPKHARQEMTMQKVGYTMKPTKGGDEFSVYTKGEPPKRVKGKGWVVKVATIYRPLLKVLRKVSDL